MSQLLPLASAFPHADKGQLNDDAQISFRGSFVVMRIIVVTMVIMILIIKKKGKKKKKKPFVGPAQFSLSRSLSHTQSHISLQ